jgi:hypothetical protein
VDRFRGTIRRLIEAARRFQTEGVLPANAQHPELDRVRPASVLLDPGEDWITATEHARRVAGNVDLAAIPSIGDAASMAELPSCSSSLRRWPSPAG